MKSKMPWSIPSLFLVFALFTIASCGKSPSSPYPTSVSIEYRITCTQGGVTKSDAVSYTNETGGVTNMSNVALPFSKKVSRTVNIGDIAQIAVLHNNSGSSANYTFKLDILVNDKVIKTQSFPTTGPLSAALSHAFTN